jgi:glycosyltransferase involved in cell wall biosynthesis
MARVAARRRQPQAPVRTLVVFHSGDDSGPARTLEPRVRALAERGNAVAVFPWTGDAVERYASFASVEVLGYEPLTLPRAPGEALAAARGLAVGGARLAAALRRARPSVVVVATTVVPAALLAARAAAVPSVLYAAEIHDKGFERSRTRAVSARLLLAAEERLASAVVACSRAVAAALRRADVVYPGIDAAAEAPSRAEARAALGLAADAFVVASIGNVTAGRGQDVLVRAVAALAGRVECLVAGAPHRRPIDRAYRDELASLVDRLGVQDRVRLLGYVPDPAPVLAAADVVVNPARFNEPFGRVGVEAVIARRPVVATRVGAVHEVLGGLAVLVDPDDPGALADGIARVRESPPDERTLEARRREASRRFSIERQTGRFVEIVLAAAGATGTRGSDAPGASATGLGSD